MVAVITRYLGDANIQSAEDVVQDTLLKAADHWEKNGIPPNPEAWLYITAKRLTLNIHRKEKYKIRYEQETQYSDPEINFSEDIIADEELRMIFACSEPTLSEETQLALILKILCGFSIQEISASFFSNPETINKRLVRGRKKLKLSGFSIQTNTDIPNRLPVVIKSIYLLFNEGYSPNLKNEIIRYDLCIEAIRLGEILNAHDAIKVKSDVHSLLALMYLNTARFQSRVDFEGNIVEMKNQDRTLWDKELILKGLDYLHYATSNEGYVSKYLILAAISAHHCTATSYRDTNWAEILALYDSLISLEDSSIVRLNRAVISAQVHGNNYAINDLTDLDKKSDIAEFYLYHSTLAELYARTKQYSKAIDSFELAISNCSNDRNKKLLEKKLSSLVPL